MWCERSGLIERPVEAVWSLARAGVFAPRHLAAITDLALGAPSPQPRVALHLATERHDRRSFLCQLGICRWQFILIVRAHMARAQGSRAHYPWIEFYTLACSAQGANAAGLLERPDL